MLAFRFSLFRAFFFPFFCFIGDFSYDIHCHTTQAGFFSYVQLNVFESQDKNCEWILIFSYLDIELFEKNPET